MRFRVRHRSLYRYQRRVDLAQHVLRLTPRNLPWQVVLVSEIAVEPEPTARGEGADYFGNRVTFIAVEKAHDLFSVALDATVDVAFPDSPEPAGTPAWETVRDRLREGGDRDLLEAGEFTYDSPLAAADPAIADYAALSFPAGRPLLEAIGDLTSRIHRDFVFDPTATVVTTPLAEVMQQRRGVCQDFAHLEVAAIRAMGLPARYVSGYIRTYREAGPDFAGTDASHAWVSVYCPGAGWVDFDPTNDLRVKDEHIVLAWGRDYGDVSPIRGVLLGGGEHSLDVAVEVTPLP